MLKLHKIDDSHVQFSTSLNDIEYDKMDFLDAVEDYDFTCKTDKSKSFGYFGEHGLIENVSHCVESIEIDEENDWVYGTVVLCDTPKGNQVKEILKNNLTQYLNMDFNIVDSDCPEIVSIDFYM